MSPGIYDGRYFVFLLNSSEYNPTHVLFRDKDIKLKHSHPEYRWREKYYLYPAILQKRWFEYRINGRYIPSSRFDTTLPLLIDYPFLVKNRNEIALNIRSLDTNYRNLKIVIRDKDKNIVKKCVIKNLLKDEKKTLEVKDLKYGSYEIYVDYNERSFYKGCMFLVNEKNIEYWSLEDLIDAVRSINQQKNKRILKEIKIYCLNCKSEVFPLKPHTLTNYQYMNYIPFKEYVDFERLSEENVKEYLMKAKHPGSYRSGLIHLLNIIRMASLEDELKIIQSIFRDDPPFGYFITEKLFFFELIPLMKDRDLQNILTKIDDDTIFSSIEGARQEIRDKILNNISKRRTKYILENKIKSDEEKTENSRQFVSREIRKYCVSVYGRLIKIPSNTINSYRIFWDPEFLDKIKEFHCGKFLVLFDEALKLIEDNSNEPVCKSYEVEYSNQNPVIITGITESAILMLIKEPLKYLYVHVYYWINNLEDFKFYENIPKNTVIPFNYRSPAIIITLGGMNLENRPLEQIIRLKMGS